MLHSARDAWITFQEFACMPHSLKKDIMHFSTNPAIKFDTTAYGRIKKEDDFLYNFPHIKKIYIRSSALDLEL